MVSALPRALQEQVVRYLAADNFIAAKKLHDAWIKQQAMQNATD